MSSTDSVSDLAARLRIVEHELVRVSAELRHHHESHERTGGMIGNVFDRLGSLEESRAKFVGLMFGVGFLGSGTGGAIAVAGFKLFGH